MSHTAYTRLNTHEQVILENKFSMMTDVYLGDNMPDPKFMTGLAWHYKDEKVNYHFKHDDWPLPCFPFEKRAKHSY